MDERQFRHLLDKYIRGESTPEENDLLHRFYHSYQEASPSEPAAFDQWVEKERIYKNIRQDIGEDHRPPPNPREVRYLRMQLKSVASWLLIAGGGVAIYLFFWPTPAPEVTWVEKSTQKGQKATIQLPDGTTVHLNVDSRLSFPEPFAAEQRAVTLAGEAFFEVARNTKRPFIITTPTLTTTVLGTSFNIKAFEGEPAQVTVASGQVNVKAAHRDGHPQEVHLLPYQQASYDGRLTKQPVDIQPFVAWREKIVQFDEVSLLEAVVVLERWFNVTITVDDRLCPYTISGTYIDETLMNILESFVHILPITYRTEGERNYVITGPPCNS